MKAVNDWRHDLDELRKQGEALEAFAIAKNLPDGFMVRPHWPGLDWVEHGYDIDARGETSLARFRAMCEATSAALGAAPTKVDARHWIGAYEGSTPDLVAEWKIDGHEITVRILSPKGCKLDPRVEFIKAQEPQLHPECKAALIEIEDALDKEVRP